MSRQRLDQLLRSVAGLDRLLIMPHNNPDPDALASALALRYLLVEKTGIKCEVTCQGVVGRAENRALARYLGVELLNVSPDDLDGTTPIALVDTQPGAGNNAWKPGVPVRVVVDHHSLRETASLAAYADIRSDVGATSTMLTGYLQAAELDPPKPLVTALFYGIKTDTRGLSRGARQADVDAYLYLLPRVDIDALNDIENAQVPVDYFRTLVDAFGAACAYDGVVIAYAGWVHQPDIVAEIADILLRLDGAHWALCMGAYDGHLVISVRTNTECSAGLLVQQIVGERGAAGGHGIMAGGDVPLNGDDPAQLAEELGRRALRYLNVSSTAPITDLVGRATVCKDLGQG